eukprot:m.231463 g.231463  ORF g.231463 m.231463 type:complete len:117 (-) comp17366_c0_seq12:644-994(-)
MLLLKVLPLHELMTMIYPRLYCLTDMTDAMGLKDERSRLPMPIMQALSAERLSRTGMYLLSSSEAVYIFIGSACEANVVKDVFGTDLANVKPEYGFGRWRESKWNVNWCVRGINVR